jgi:hypothetical protein
MFQRELFHDWHPILQDREEKEKQMSAKASVEEIQDGLNSTEEIIELQDLRSAFLLHFGANRASFSGISSFCNRGSSQ